MNNLRWKIAQAAEIRWWQGYLKKKSPVSYLTWKRNYWRDFLKKTGLDIQTGQTILDAGCGPAGIFMIFEDHRVDALDPLLEQYEERLEHFDRKAYPSTRFFAQSLESFQTAQQYDVVFCLNAINHVSDLQKCMDNLIRAVQPGGHLVLSIDAHNYPWLKKIFRALPGDVLHPHQYDLTEYQRMLLERNCTIQKSILVKEELIFNYYVLVGKV